MFTLIIILTMVNNPAIMKSEVGGFETLAECSQERDRVLRLKNHIQEKYK